MMINARRTPTSPMLPAPHDLLQAAALLIRLTRH
jgi:hypothetical protein